MFGRLDEMLTAAAVAYVTRRPKDPKPPKPGKPVSSPNRFCCDEAWYGDDTCWTCGGPGKALTDLPNSATSKMSWCSPHSVYFEDE